ncbi:MAG: carboxypeptidase regulatory-like domain-containing protein [bacterium]|nr:carboxypeptidase regulatory-like domain-containing protein [bacterium]
MSKGKMPSRVSVVSVVAVGVMSILLLLGGQDPEPDRVGTQPATSQPSEPASSTLSAAREPDLTSQRAGVAGSEVPANVGTSVESAREVLVRGRLVVGPMKQPGIGYRVVLETGLVEPIRAEVKIKEAGDFELQAPCAVSPKLGVWKNGRILLSVPMPLLSKGEDEAVDVGDVWIRETASYAGIVLDVEGRPVPNAQVLCASSALNGQMVDMRPTMRGGCYVATHTNDAGEFQVEVAENAGVNYLLVSRERDCGALGPLGAVESAGNTINLRPKQRLDFIVTQGQSRVAGAEVGIWGGGLPWRLSPALTPNALTGLDGTASIWIPPLDASVANASIQPSHQRVTAYAKKASAYGKVALQSGGTDQSVQAQVNLKSVPTATEVVGQVIDSDNQPIGGATVTAGGFVQLTGDDGAFSISFPSPQDLPIEVHASAAGYADRRHFWGARPGDSEREFVLQMNKGRVVDIALLDTEALKLANMAVTLTPHQRGAMRLWSVTDAHGVATFSGLDRFSSYDIRIDPPADFTWCRDPRKTPLQLPPDLTSMEVRLERYQGALASATLTAIDSDTGHRAQIEWIRCAAIGDEERCRPSAPREYVLGVDGATLEGLAAGRYMVAIAASGGRLALTEFVAREGVREVFHVPVSRRRRALGRLVDPRSCAGVEVVATALCQDGTPIMERVQWSSRHIPMERQGDTKKARCEFVIDGLAPAVYRVVAARAPDGVVVAQTTVDLLGGDSIDIELVAK